MKLPCTNIKRALDAELDIKDPERTLWLLNRREYRSEEALFSSGQEWSRGR